MIYSKEIIVLGRPCGGGGGGGGGGALPYKRLMGMCRWMGLHFHDWIDYNGVAFSKELLEWGRTFSGFGLRQLFIFTVSKIPGYLYCR